MAWFQIKQRILNYSLYILVGSEGPNWGGGGAYLLTFIYVLDKPFGNSLFIFFYTISLGLIKPTTSHCRVLCFLAKCIFRMN